MTFAKQYAAGLNAIEATVTHSIPYFFSAGTPGRRYTRIIQRVPTGQSVHAFVENATGHVFKAAGWTGPAKGIRYMSVEDALEAARSVPFMAAFGGYLYANR